MQKLSFTFFMMSLLIMSACSGLTGDTGTIAEPTAIVITLQPTVAAVTEEPTQEVIVVTATPTEPVPTSQDQGTSNSADNTVACQPSQLNWPVYVIQAGDTLGQIAQRTASTAEELARVNCISDPNQITVGQSIRVRQPAQSTVPVINQTPESPTACMVAGNSGVSYVWQLGNQEPSAYLVRARFVDEADNAFIIDTPSLGGNSWVSKTEAQLVGADCARFSIPIISQTAPYTGACMVVTNGDGASIWRPGPATPVALLVSAEFVRIADNFYVINTPSLGGESTVSRMEAQLLGQDCPDETVSLDCMEVLQANNGMRITPSTNAGQDCVSVPAGTVTVSWDEAPADYAMVEFWMLHANGSTDVIGTDTSPADGAMISYTVSTAFQKALVYTILYAEDHSVESGQLAVYRRNG